MQQAVEPTPVRQRARKGDDRPQRLALANLFQFIKIKTCGRDEPRPIPDRDKVHARLDSMGSLLSKSGAHGLGLGLLLPPRLFALSIFLLPANHRGGDHSLVIDGEPLDVARLQRPMQAVFLSW